MRGRGVESVFTHYFYIATKTDLTSYLSVLSWGISFQLVEKPAEIKLIIIPDDFRNFIDGIGDVYKRQASMRTLRKKQMF